MGKKHIEKNLAEALLNGGKDENDTVHINEAARQQLQMVFTHFTYCECKRLERQTQYWK